MFLLHRNVAPSSGISASRPLRNKNGTGAEMPPAVVSGIVTGDSPVSYWLFFPSVSPVTFPDVFAKVRWTKFS